MEKVFFADSWQQFFAGLGMARFDDFFSYAGGEQINKNNKRDVQIMTLGRGDYSKECFLKRFHRPHVKDAIFALSNFGRPCSQAKWEWYNAGALIDNGIDTYPFVCYGEQTFGGFERRSFLISEKLKSQCFTDFVAENWTKLSQEWKEKITTELAAFIRRIHDADFCLPDLYVWHIFIKETQQSDNWDFAVIDLNRMQYNVTNTNKKLKNLSRFYHSMTDKYFDDRTRRVFIQSYAGSDWPGCTDKLFEKVNKYSKAVSAKRNPKPY